VISDGFDIIDTKVLAAYSSVHRLLEFIKAATRQVTGGAHRVTNFLLGALEAVEVAHGLELVTGSRFVKRSQFSVVS
jgi:hypothetical protein